MRTKKGNGSLSVNGQNEDNATNVSKHIKRDRSGTLHSLATPNKSTRNGTPSKTQKFVTRTHEASPLKDPSSVRTRSSASVRSAAPASGRVKVRTGKVTQDTMTVITLARLKCSRRTFEGGPISEERFREMQAESYRLKRDLADKEELQKALVARLNRAEDSVKRTFRASVENTSLLPKEKVSALAVLTQNFNTEKKVDELEERLRVSHRYNLRYLQHVRRCKAEIEWYKRRLDATVRASTRARSCNCQLSLKRDEKMVKDVRKQSSSLPKTKNCRGCWATSQSAVLLDVSKLSTEDHNCPSGLLSSQEGFGPHSLEPKVGNVQDAASDPVHQGDYLEETEMDGSKLQKQREFMHSTSPKATETSLTETLQEQSLYGSLSAFDATTQLMATCKRLKIVTLKHSKTTEELRLLKVSHESCVQKLQDTLRKLSQERTTCLKLEAAEKRLSSELMAAKHLEPLLQQVRQQNVQLEIENAELVASALNVPRTSFSELTILRQQLVEELKQRKIAEVKASNVSTQLEDCKQDLARLAVVEAKWEFLKSELVVAKAALRKAYRKIKELQDLTKRLQKEIDMKGKGCLQMDSDTNVSCGPSCEEEKITHLDRIPDQILTKESEIEPELGGGVEDNISLEDENLYKDQIPQSGLQAVQHENKVEDFDNVAIIVNMMTMYTPLVSDNQAVIFLTREEVL